MLRQQPKTGPAEKAKRVMQAMLQMNKIDIEALQRAHGQ
jgi:predicted 3-demethylubiquinone-9 3-methyltransferase (glyoxalase superfamily)